MSTEKQKMNAIDVNNVCINYKLLNSTTIRKSFLRKRKKEEIVEAVKNVSFSVKEGEVLGIIGKNGSGKSTLLRSIAGVFSPNAGSIDLKNHSVSLMALGIGFREELSGRENIFLSGMLLGFSEKDISDKLQDIIDFAEIGGFIDKPVRTYSSGMHSKLAFSITAVLESDIILIDEVLSVGDEKFRQKSLNRMKEMIEDKNHTVIIVSHSTDLLRQMCDEVMWMHEGEIKEMGAPSEVLEHYLDFMR